MDGPSYRPRKRPGTKTHLTPIAGPATLTPAAPEPGELRDGYPWAITRPWTQERVPQRGASGFLGGSLTGLESIHWPDQVDQDPSRQPLPQRRARGFGDVRGAVEKHLLLRQIPTD